MKQFIVPYLEDHINAWAPTTLKVEQSRLNSVAEQLSKGPEKLYQYLLGLGQKPYTIKTTFVRVCAMEAWAGLKPKYRDWMKKHRNKFKYAYQKAELELSYEDALSRIRSISDSHIRAHALGLIQTGCRLSESYGVHNGQVVGKGGKPRRIFGKIEGTVSKSTLWRKLREVGIRPHDLRKLCATRLAEKGASHADLMKVFGWSSIKTASIYLQGRSDERLQALMETSKEG